MSLTNEELVEYAALLEKKTDSTEKQIKPSPLKERPRRVPMKPDECKSLCEATGLEYHTGYENRVMERITTTEAVDRDGDIVRYEGIDNSEFRIEPVVLFAHDRGSLPVGRSLKEWKDKNILGWRSWDVYFDDQIDTTGKSDVIFRMVSNGAMRGGSIGFLSKEVKCDHSEEERKKIGLGKYGVEFRRVLKLEHSACSVPANQEALANSINSLDRKMIQGSLTVKDLDVLERHCMLDNNMIDVLYDVLGVKRVVSIPKIEPVLNKGKEVSMENEEFDKKGIDKTTNIVLNLDMKGVKEELDTLSEKMKTIEEKADNILKSFTDKVESLIATANKAISAIERTKTDSKFYDQGKLEQILKL